VSKISLYASMTHVTNKKIRCMTCQRTVTSFWWHCCYSAWANLSLDHSCAIKEALKYLPVDLTREVDLDEPGLVRLNSISSYQSWPHFNMRCGIGMSLWMLDVQFFYSVCKYVSVVACLWT